MDVHISFFLPPPSPFLHCYIYIFNLRFRLGGLIARVHFACALATEGVWNIDSIDQDPDRGCYRGPAAILHSAWWPQSLTLVAEAGEEGSRRGGLILMWTIERGRERESAEEKERDEGYLGWVEAQGLERGDGEADVGGSEWEDRLESTVALCPGPQAWSTLS